MAGFFGLFGSKAKYLDEVTEQDRQAAPKDEAFYLDADEAKSLGNLDFMRKPKIVKRTFPKTFSSQGGELIQEISSMQKAKSNGNGNGSVPTASTSNGTTSATPAQSDRRSADNSMDMFRQMAREMKK